MPNEHRPPTLTEPDSDDDPLYRAASDVERGTALVAEMADRETATIGDGLAERMSPH